MSLTNGNNTLTLTLTDSTGKQKATFTYFDLSYEVTVNIEEAISQALIALARKHIASNKTPA